MYKFMIRYPVAMSEEDLIDHLTGAGADCYPWWRSIEVTDIGELLLAADDPTDFNGDYPAVSKLIPISEVVESIQLMLDDPKTNQEVLTSFIEDDIDSDVADMILQTLLFGKIIYG